MLFLGLPAMTSLHLHRTRDEEQCHDFSREAGAAGAWAPLAKRLLSLRTPGIWVGSFFVTAGRMHCRVVGHMPGLSPLVASNSPKL